MNTRVPVLLSSSSVFPEPTAAAFELAAALGYDGVEVMVWTDAVSQDAGALRGLSAHYGVPVRSVHAPCLLFTQRVWSSDPWERLARSAALAETLGAPTVVVHPPFSWQREYARSFETGLARLAGQHPGVRFAVENMFPVRMAGRQFVPYTPGWDPTQAGYDAYTLDLSHCAVSRSDPLAMADRMGDRLVHVHLGDGTGEPRDEHLVPGRGSQACGPLLASLVRRGRTSAAGSPSGAEGTSGPAGTSSAEGNGGFRGAVAVEVSTRRASSRAEREADLTEALAFARQHLAIPLPATPPVGGASAAGSGHRREVGGVGGHPDRGALAGPVRSDM